MNSKQLKIILVLGIVFGGLGLSLYLKKSASWKGSDSEIGRLLLGEPNQETISSVATISIKKGNDEVNLIKEENDTWSIKERYGYSANFGNITSFVRKMYFMKILQTVRVGESQYGRLGLDPEDSGDTALTQVQFLDTDGKTVKSFNLGKDHESQSNSAPGPMGFPTGGMPSGRYVSIDGEEGKVKVFIIDDSLRSITPEADQWLNKDFFKLEKIKSVKVTPHKEDELGWTLVREDDNGNFELSDTTENEEFDSSKTSGFKYLMSSPYFSDIVDPEENPEETGLDKPIRAEIETFEHFNYVFKIGKNEDEDKYYLSLTVDADFPKEREKIEGEEDQEEDEETKKKKDEEFQKQLKVWKEKLAVEKRYEKWVYNISKYTVDNLMKSRSEFMKEPEEEDDEDGEEKSSDSSEDVSISKTVIPTEFPSVVSEPVKVTIPQTPPVPGLLEKMLDDNKPSALVIEGIPEQVPVNKQETIPGSDTSEETDNEVDIPGEKDPTTETETKKESSDDIEETTENAPDDVDSDDEIVDEKPPDAEGVESSSPDEEKEAEVASPGA